jgi:hypothetical protein
MTGRINRSIFRKESADGDPISPSSHLPFRVLFLERSAQTLAAYSSSPLLLATEVPQAAVLLDSGT